MLWKPVAAVAMLAVAAAACDDATNPMVGRGQNVSLSFASRVGTGPLASAAGTTPAGLAAVTAVANDSMVLVFNNDTLIITSIEVLLREVELKRANTTDCDSTANVDACEEFEVGALLVDVPLIPGAAAQVTVAIDSGSYSEVEFDVHKLGTDASDNAFAALHPDWPVNVSIRVRGRFNGTSFTYVTGLDQEQEIQFVPLLVVDASGSTTNLTVMFDATNWFRSAPGGALINPATANEGGPNVSLVENNIKNSIEAFHDHDRDGDETDH